MLMGSQPNSLASSFITNSTTTKFPQPFQNNPEQPNKKLILQSQSTVMPCFFKAASAQKLIFNKIVTNVCKPRALSDNKREIAENADNFENNDAWEQTDLSLS